MMELFRGLFDSSTGNTVEVTHFLLCLAVALLLGLVMAVTYRSSSRATKSFLMTLATLPAVVCVVILMVNGNIGAGVAVAGTFSLVRFRSLPGTAREIGMLFLAMGAGLVTGMGYLGYAILFTMIMCGCFFLYDHMDFGLTKEEARYKTMRITIPEDLDYTSIFDDILESYTRKWELVRVKSHNMGSMFQLTYNIILKDASREKEMIDKIRCRNGNLEITVSRQDITETAL